MKTLNLIKLCTLCFLFNIGVNTSFSSQDNEISNYHNQYFTTICTNNNMRQYLAIPNTTLSSLQHDVVIRTYNQAFRYNKKANAIFLL